jgi:hypothetical protein
MFCISYSILKCICIMVLILNVTVEWFVPLLGIQKVLDSNVGTETGYLSVFCISSITRQITVYNLKVCLGCF